jgi:hypothetical protein
MQLDIAESLGWIDSEEKKIILENHIRDLELAAQNGQDGNDAERPSHQHVFRKSLDSTGSGSSGTTKSRGVAAPINGFGGQSKKTPSSSQQQQQQQQQQSTAAGQQPVSRKVSASSTTTQAFDYSKYTDNSGAGAILSASAASTAGKSQTQQKGSVFNPYFAATVPNANGQNKTQTIPKKIGKSSGSGDKKDASAPGVGTYDRKSKEKTFVYSNK